MTLDPPVAHRAAVGGVQTHPLRDLTGQKQKKSTETFRQKKRKVALLMEEDRKCLEEDRKEAELKRLDSARCGPRWGREEVLAQR